MMLTYLQIIEDYIRAETYNPLSRDNKPISRYIHFTCLYLIPDTCRYMQIQPTVPLPAASALALGLLVLKPGVSTNSNTPPEVRSSHSFTARLPASPVHCHTMMQHGPEIRLVIPSTSPVLGRNSDRSEILCPVT
jgi:hypothetical protein